MAQLVESVLGKDEVGGSNPPSSSKRKTAHLGGFLWLYVKCCGIENQYKIAVDNMTSVLYNDMGGESWNLCILRKSS